MMNTVSILILNLLLIAASGFVSATASPASAPKPNSIIGTVIAYDYFNTLALVVAPSRVVMIVRTKSRKGHKSGLIQVAYDYYASAIPNKDGFPNALTDRARQWRFKLLRDPSCDRPVQEFTSMQAEHLDNGKTTEERMAVWKLIAGAETEKIPFGETLPCYSLTVGGYKPYGK
jgi:hypothetical protein